MEMGRVFLSVVGLQVVGHRYLQGEGWLSLPQQDFHNKGND
jgi:hypothetical protein